MSLSLKPNCYALPLGAANYLSSSQGAASLKRLGNTDLQYIFCFCSACKLRSSCGRISATDQDFSNLQI